MNLFDRIYRKIIWTIDGSKWSLQSNGLSNTLKNHLSGILSRRVVRPQGGSEAVKTYLLYARDSQFPLHCRFRSSDRDVFRMIFEAYEYGCLNDMKDVRLVIDCGANVGYASAYFLTRFPQATVIAIEPDSKNFALLEQNLKPYGNRVKLYQTGVWSHATGLKVCRGEFGDGREWATQVRESCPGETQDLQALDIGTILHESGFDKIDILKIDIERSETEVFSRNYAEWLCRTRTMAIELHDEECERIFHRAIAEYPFSLSTSGELVVCKTS
jgi:FkbM family methyltransferase